MPYYRRFDSGAFEGKVIDAHTHVGISTLDYLAGSIPYCQSVESLLYRMNMNRVDCAVSFPLGGCAFFDRLRFLRDRHLVPASPRLSRAPYVVENRLLCEEIYEKVPDACERIMAFACIDPGRYVREQVKAIAALIEKYPIYGLKASGVSVQSSHRHLTGKASAFMHLARKHNLPLLLHSTAYEGDTLCHSKINLDVARAFPEVRFCLAHCLGFDRHHLAEADSLPNVWVDSAAMKIQVEPEEILAPLHRRYESDYSDFRRVFRDLVRAYPDTMIWGSDSPAYTFVHRRKYADGSTVSFDLQGSYELERAALDALSAAQRRKVANINTCRFLFGADAA